MDESNHHGLINPKNQSMYIIYIIYIIYCIQYYTIIFNYCVTEGSLEVKLPTTWKSQKKESEERVGRKSQKKESEAKVRRKSQRKKMQAHKKVEKSQLTVICGFVGSKSRLAKAAGAEPPGLMRNEKLHAVVTRSTFQNQNVLNNLNIPFSERFWKLPCQKSARRRGAKHISKSNHFWKLRCRKSARHCGAKHISKSKC